MWRRFVSHAIRQSTAEWGRTVVPGFFTCLLTCFTGKRSVSSAPWHVAAVRAHFSVSVLLLLRLCTPADTLIVAEHRQHKDMRDKRAARCTDELSSSLRGQLSHQPGQSLTEQSVYSGPDIHLIKEKVLELELIMLYMICHSDNKKELSVI